MKKILWVGMVLLMLFAISGCRKLTPDKTIATRFEGVWTGTWNVPKQDSGTITLYIAKDGTIHGTIANIITVASANLLGQVTESGFTIIYQYPGLSEMTWTGSVVSMQYYHITGNFTFLYLGSSTNGTFDLEKQ